MIFIDIILINKKLFQRLDYYLILLKALMELRSLSALEDILRLLIIEFLMS